MNIVILYSTRHGSAQKCAELLQSRLEGEVTLVNAKEDPLPDVGSFDCVILGSSIYAGRVGKAIKAFVAANLDQLLQKTVLLFVCGAFDKPEYFKENFPDVLCRHAREKVNFGGEMNVQDMGFFEKAIVKLVSSREKTVAAIHEDRIEAFASTVNGISK